MITSPRYGHEVLAWEYDQRTDLTNGELEWYLKYAGKSGSPILELACGSGRLLIPIAEAGYEIDGVDVSEAMLERLRDRKHNLDSEAQSRIGIYCCDMATFTPERKYELVFIGNNSLQYLETKDRHLICFRDVYGYLKNGGYFLAMVTRFDPSRYAGGRKHVVDWLDKPVVDEEKDLSVGSKFVSYIEPGGERVVWERTYRIDQRGAEPEIIECVTYTPIITVSEYIGMLEKSGFEAKAYSGYEQQSEDENSRIVCFVAHKVLEERALIGHKLS